MGINYTRQGDYIEVIIRDFSGAKMESHTCNAHDKKRYTNLLRYLKDKYGFSPEIDIEDSVNYKETEGEWWS